jgi:exodeoxyribonuclease VII small subunit
VSKLSFEEAFERLETTVRRLDDGELTLEEAITLYEEGMRLAGYCNEALDAAELQVEQLAVANDQGQLSLFLGQDEE